MRDKRSVAGVRGGCARDEDVRRRCKSTGERGLSGHRGAEGSLWTIKTSDS
jgi:hypothetical protein